MNPRLLCDQSVCNIFCFLLQSSIQNIAHPDSSGLHMKCHIHVNFVCQHCIRMCAGISHAKGKDFSWALWYRKFPDPCVKNWIVLPLYTLLQKCYNDVPPTFTGILAFSSQTCNGSQLVSCTKSQSNDDLHVHDKQTSSQRKCREHLSNQPSHRDNATHQGISISQPCYEDEWMECEWDQLNSA